jgi:flavodoxin
MKNIKRVAACLLIFSLILAFAGCGGTDEENKEANKNKDVTEEEQNKSDKSADKEKDGNTLVVYFSETGTTKGVAKTIASVTGADTYEITPAEPYSDADLDYNDSESRTTKEQKDSKARPKISSDKIDLTKYSTIYIGYPIWWGEEPRIMDTFVEDNDFGKATVIPFCTSGGSGIGNSGKNLEANAKGGKWLEGERLDGDVSEAEIKEWIGTLGI